MIFLSFEEIIDSGLKYRVAVADPPWCFDNAVTGGSQTSGAGQKYPVIKTDEMGQLPIREFMARDSVMLMWGTTPMLPEALQTLNAWGYTYKTTIYWYKVDPGTMTGRLGLGAWFRGQVEYCLVGKRGRVKAFRCQEPNVILEKPGAHSQKPTAFWDLVGPVLDRHEMAPRIELFARETRPGWDAFGNQIPDRIYQAPGPCGGVVIAPWISK
jgi:N6-adenosine-specific RNA methylase IME4